MKQRQTLIEMLMPVISKTPNNRAPKFTPSEFFELAQRTLPEPYSLTPQEAKLARYLYDEITPTGDRRYTRYYYIFVAAIWIAKLVNHGVPLPKQLVQPKTIHGLQPILDVMMTMKMLLRREKQEMPSYAFYILRIVPKLCREAHLSPTRSRYAMYLVQEMRRACQITTWTAHAAVWMAKYITKHYQMGRYSYICHVKGEQQKFSEKYGITPGVLTRTQHDIERCVRVLTPGFLRRDVTFHSPTKIAAKAYTLREVK